MTKAEAIKVAHKMKQQNPGQFFDGYLCETCKQWHVGHRPRNIQQKISANRALREKDR